MILDEEMGPQLQIIAKMIGLGYGPILRWNEIEKEARLAVEKKEASGTMRKGKTGKLVFLNRKIHDRREKTHRQLEVQDRF
jgi:hypothetical protein